MSSSPQPQRQNAHLTHRANVGVGRHGWLRLTPAYSVRLVRDRVAHLSPGSVITDPFSGTGTTPLAAAEHGCFGQSIDVNPFLIWLGTAKLRNYEQASIKEAIQALPRIAEQTGKWVLEASDLWQPNLFKIERWWSQETLAAVKALRHVLDQTCLPKECLDLLDIAFCRTMIGTSNASFNHQSMSFKQADSAPALFDPDAGSLVIARFIDEARDVLESASLDLPGSGAVICGDSRAEKPEALTQCDLLLTSPPYVNRMSYIRELRPYMYWLRFLDKASDAGELDWKAIGGTWGTATSRLNDWIPGENILPIDAEMQQVKASMVRDGGKNGPLLGTYVVKYFHDIFAHLDAAYGYVKSGGRAAYIIGNSTFYGHVVPAEQWYAKMMVEVGFTDVQVTTIRKRNSNTALYEFEVSGNRP